MVKCITDGKGAGWYRLGYSFRYPVYKSEYTVWFKMLRWASERKDITRNDVLRNFPVKDYEIWIELGRAGYLHYDYANKYGKKIWNLTASGSNRIRSCLNAARSQCSKAEFESLEKSV